MNKGRHYNPEPRVRGINRPVRKIVIHCSASRVTSAVTADTIRSWHKGQGWSDIGYHWVIEKDGTISEGRHPAKPGAHVRGHNHDSLGICYVGGLDEKGKASDTRTTEQRQSMTNLVTKLIALFPTAQVLGHRDLSPDRDGDGVVEKHEWVKECPCFPVKLWWNGEY